MPQSEAAYLYSFGRPNRHSFSSSELEAPNAVRRKTSTLKVIYLDYCYNL